MSFPTPKKIADIQENEDAIETGTNPPPPYPNPDTKQQNNNSENTNGLEALNEFSDNDDIEMQIANNNVRDTELRPPRRTCKLGPFQAMFFWVGCLWSILLVIRVTIYLFQGY